ncbi:MAG: hypothetical protein ACM3NH_00250 [Candidatus Saccharibacteria bacterium]
MMKIAGAALVICLLSGSGALAPVTLPTPSADAREEISVMNRWDGQKGSVTFRFSVRDESHGGSEFRIFDYLLDEVEIVLGGKTLVINKKTASEEQLNLWLGRFREILLELSVLHPDPPSPELRGV